MRTHTPGPFVAFTERVHLRVSGFELCTAARTDAQNHLVLLGVVRRREDALLFAEAPTLLALLRECLANSPGRTSDWRSRVEESIARIEGRTP